MTDTHPVHLLVLIHGFWGNPGHLAELDRIIRETKQKQSADVDFEVLVAETNREESTYDGIDWGAERVAKEVTNKVEVIAQDGRKVTRLSVTGYSLGGLIGRYMIGVLHQRKFFDDVTPVNFTTFATPHIGIPRYPGIFSALASTVGPRLLSRTGQQFFTQDKWSKKGRPLLEVMADPDRVFYQALNLFPNLTIYANAVHDMTVPYLTGAFETEDPFLHQEVNGLEVEFDETYKPLVKTWKLPDVPPERPVKPRAFTGPWFKAIKDYQMPLPPPLQYSFPGNLVVYTLLPVLIPAFLGLVVVRLSLSSRSSRNRIKLLEKDETYAERLAHIVAEMEKRMEDAVVDAVEGMGGEPLVHADAASSAPARSPSQRTLAAAPAAPAEYKQLTNPKCGTKPSHDATGKGKATALGGESPVLTDVQLRIVASLNTLPNLTKRLAFIHPTRNSHGTIVARDVRRFEFHRIGWGVIQHWADNFVL